MYRLAREWLPVPQALFAAVFYALNPYHLLIVYWRSAYAELLAAALLPLLGLCLLRLVSLEPGLGLRATLCLSLILAAAWLTNVPAAVMVHYSTAGLALILAATEATPTPSSSPQIWRPSPRMTVRTLTRTALAMLLGAGLASFYLLPAIYEQRWINLNEVLSPGVRPQDNFLFTATADPDHNRFNLFVSTIALAEMGALAFAMWFSRTKQRVETAAGSPVAGSATGAAAVRTLWMLLSAWGLGSAVLMLSVSNLLWLHLPKFRFVQLPFRWLLCMNVALAILLPMAPKRWTRLLASAGLLAVVIFAGYRIQPPWWDTSRDIREMSDALANGTGYEGTDEYVPAGADPYELDKGLARLSDDTGVPVRSAILAWEQTEKHFTVHALAPQNVTVRLFAYPAWEVTVNGKPTKTQATDVTHLIVIPIAAGDNDVRIYFHRTSDRVVGDLISLISLVVLVVAWIKTKTRHEELQPASATSPAA